MKVSTGIENLDEIMEGGFIERSFNLIYGEGGTGKTMLTLNYLINGAEHGKNVLYISLEESWSDINRNIPDSMKKRLDKIKGNFHYLDFGSLRPILGKEVLKSEVLTEAITSSIMVHHVAMVGIDGIAPLSMYYDEPRKVRSAIFRLSQTLKNYAVTTVFTSEEIDGKSRYGVEEYVADSVIRLFYNGRVRRIMVLKTRGSDFVGGKHGLEIRENGIIVYPRMLSVENRTKISPETLEIAKLDMMMGEIFKGDAILLSGPPGTGKSIFGLHFIKSTCGTGKRGVFVSFESSVLKLQRRFKDMGGDLKNCKFTYIDPLDSDIYKMLWDLKKVCETANRVVLEGVNTLPKDNEYYEFMHMFIKFLRAKNITSIFTYTTPFIISTNTIGDDKISYLFDNIINLRFAEIGGELKKILVIIRSHTPTHDRGLIEYRIGRKGIIVVGKIEEMEGIMTGVPSKQIEIKKRVERFFK